MHDGALHPVLDRLGAASGPADDGLLRGLVFAIVDEADSIFIDEARTPLILSARLPLSPAQGAAHAGLRGKRWRWRRHCSPAGISACRPAAARPG